MTSSIQINQELNYFAPGSLRMPLIKLRIVLQKHNPHRSYFNSVNMKTMHYA